MTQDEIAQIIKTEAEALAGSPLESLDSQVFIKNTWLDSMSMLNLVLYLEERFNVEIDVFFEDRPSVPSVNLLATYIASRIEQHQ